MGWIVFGLLGVPAGIYLPDMWSGNEVRRRTARAVVALSIAAYVAFCWLDLRVNALTKIVTLPDAGMSAQILEAIK